MVNFVPVDSPERKHRERRVFKETGEDASSLSAEALVAKCLRLEVLKTSGSWAPDDFWKPWAE